MRRCGGVAVMVNEARGNLTMDIDLFGITHQLLASATPIGLSTICVLLLLPFHPRNL